MEVVVICLHPHGLAEVSRIFKSEPIPTVDGIDDVLVALMRSLQACSSDRMSAAMEPASPKVLSVVAMMSAPLFSVSKQWLSSAFKSGS